LALGATSVTVKCPPLCAVGRRPAGLGEPSMCDARDAGGYFAEIAHLEALRSSHSEICAMSYA
jgi:hypothetical protein